MVWGFPNILHMLGIFISLMTFCNLQVVLKQLSFQIFTRITDAMRKQDKHFSKMFRKTVIGGSVGDSLKVYLPDEFDLNVVLEMPKCFAVFSSNVPGHIHLKEKDVGNLKQLHDLPSFANQTEESYLLTKDLLSWLQSLITRALNTFPPATGNYEIDTKWGVYYVNNKGF